MPGRSHIDHTFRQLQRLLNTAGLINQMKEIRQFNHGILTRRLKFEVQKMRDGATPDGLIKFCCASKFDKLRLDSKLFSLAGAQGWQFRR